MSLTETAEKLAKHNSNGFLSSFLSAAHNVATMVMSEEEEEEAARKGLPSGSKHSRHLKPSSKSVNLLGLPSRTSTNSHHNNSNASLGNAHENDANSIAVKFPALPRLSTSSVHFEPVHDSPINTMGSGDLQLLHFDNKTAVGGGGRDPVPQLAIDDAEKSNKERLSVLGDEDSKVVKRRRRSSEASAQESASEEVSLESDSSNQELDKMLESSDITFASSKKNKEFHHVFRKIPLNERLIADYSCALSKDILVQGKMYLTPNYICFNSNILGWVTHLMIPLQEVIQIEKKSTAVLFPNGMIIRTLHQKYVFATFISRDTTFLQITRVWHDVLLGKDDKNNRARSASRVSNRGLYVFDSDESDNESSEVTDASDEGGESVTSDDATEGRERSSSKTKTEDDNEDDNDHDEDKIDEEDGDDDGGAAKGDSGGDFHGLTNPGPAEHEPTKADREDESNDVFVLDHTFKAPPGVVFSVLFGADTQNYAKMLEDQKNYDIEKDKIVPLSEKRKERKYVYLKPLSGPIGPKSTKCNITDRLVHCDFEKYVHVEQITQTPDVPLGGVFKIVTTILLSWAEDNSTDMHVVTSIEWSGKSWIKGAIEKGSIDGQKEAMKGLTESVTDLLELGSGGSKKKRKRSKSKKRNGPEEAPPQEAKELSLVEQITQLCETIGKSVPVGIPNVSDAMLGAIILILGSFVYTWILMFIFGGSRNNTPVVTDADDSARLLRFGNNNYYVMPSLDRYINDKLKRMVKEARIWSWINLRSRGKIPDYSRSPDRSGSTDDYASQELEEIVKLTKRRVDELYHRMSD